LEPSLVPPLRTTLERGEIGNALRGRPEQCRDQQQRGNANASSQPNTLVLVGALYHFQLGILVWSPLAGGLLSGKYRRGEQGPAGSRLW